MSKKSRTKGARGERDLVNILKAKGIESRRIPGSGAHATGHDDVEATINGETLSFEVKLRAEGFKQIYGWHEGSDALVIKADRKPRLIVMELDKFVELVK